MDMSVVNGWISQFVIPAAMKLGGAIVLWIIGGWGIRIAGRLAHRAMTIRKVDPTLIKYVESAMAVSLRIVLGIAVLGVFGIETTSFAALIAAAGLAIGAAWSGLLANFAAGAFLVLLRPFKVGDVITAGGANGRVTEIGMFTTTIHTADNLRVTIGNNKVLSDNVVNFTVNPYRVVELKAQMRHTADAVETCQRIRHALARIPNVLATPAPLVEILEFNVAGYLLAVRPACHNDNYDQVFFDTNRVIAEVIARAATP